MNFWNQPWTCPKTEIGRERVADRGTHWSAGPARQWHRDRGELVAGETRRRWGFGRIQGHSRDPLTKADLPRCKTLTLPSSRGLVSVNGGSAALRAIRRRAQPMLTRLRFMPSISESRGSSRNKKEKKWWSREAWPRHRWARAELRRGRTARSLAMPPYPRSTMALAKLLAGWLGQRRGGELGRSGWFAAELAKEEAERRESAGEGNEAGWRSGWRRGVQVEMLGLTGGVVVDVRPPQGVHASAGWRLTKQNHVIQSPSVVTVGHS